MHNNAEYWDISQQAIEFCKQNDIRHVIKANDNSDPAWHYNQQQFQFSLLYA